MGAEINPVDVFGAAANLPPRVAALLALLDDLGARVATLAGLAEDHPAQMRQIRRQAETIREDARQIRYARRSFNILCGLLGRVPCPDREMAAACEAEITVVRARLAERPAAEGA